ncbi:PEP-CTERM-box response regulator transcription factor [Alginatibacterium sediminis]|uniref:PEP-CTERM-box response regulator transcription factor n=1 Tax=Alginatibacterium sediminis TaxID=2164068 RepID=A0A420E7L8_9ALTE|nr:PEP-CTERM-box response regulator transcription factor [Alginatibacterium sediminis]RKF14405.1 PEP-CTERM-box response regulator transcription factor [Alginatibacterium sediminis]
METLLIVEDDIGIQKQLKWSLSEDYTLVFADDRQSAIAALRRYEPKVVTLDLGLPPDEANASEGLAVLEQILKLAPLTKVIVITGNEDKSNALKAIDIGAHDFYQKPIDDDTLSVIIKRAFFVSELERENASLKQVSLDHNGFIGNSPQVLQVTKMVERIAPTEVTTLLLGESGTGKEVLARAIHQRSPRRDQPFVAINCASIPENLLESELFGHEKGAFTGAVKTTLGKIETANGGTLFLDEIGDMPFPLQAKILRFLQEKVIERIGGRKEIAVDVKIVCATHQNLQEMVGQKEFREDLFYRISEITINIPPLRERDQDVVVLARYFLQLFKQQLHHDISGFSDDALKAMVDHRWPGNIRELQNKVKSAIIMADGKYITAADLCLFTQEDSPELVFNLRQVRDEAEKNAVVRALAYSNGNMSNAATVLGVTRPTLYSLLDKFHIDKDKIGGA